MPFLLFYYLFQDASVNNRKLTIVLTATPLLMCILMSASFAPSVYGQSFPEARARFAGQLILIAELMLEGACLGATFAQIKTRRQSMTGYIALGLLAVSTFYPLRTTENVLKESLPSYSQWASEWDSRKLQIFAYKSQGIQDIVVPQLPGVEHVKELDPRSTFWINRCAAQFYGVQSISAPFMGEP
jgi:hypothetical protein